MAYNATLRQICRIILFIFFLKNMICLETNSILAEIMVILYDYLTYYSKILMCFE